MREDFAEYLDFVVGGSPSRFMRHQADWDRLYRFVEFVAGAAPDARPSEDEVRTRVQASLPRRLEWVAELMLAYHHSLAILDRRRLQG